MSYSSHTVNNNTRRIPPLRRHLTLPTHTHTHIRTFIHVPILLPQNVAIDRRFLVDKTLVYRLKRIDDSTSNAAKFRRSRWKAESSSTNVGTFVLIRSIPAPNSKKYLNFIENSRYVRKENAYFDREKYSLLNWRKEEDEEDGEKRNDSSNEFSLSLSLSPQFYPSESLSQSLYRFPRIKLVLIVSRRASYFRPREHHPSVEIKRATSSSRMPNRQKRYLFHPPSTVISHREHLLVKMEFSYSQRDPIRSWTDGRANGMRDTRSSEIRFLDTLGRVSIFVQSFLLEIIDQASNIVSNDNEWWLEDRQQRGVCVCVSTTLFQSDDLDGFFVT